VARELTPIEVERIFLYEENPRHEPLGSEPEVIEHLCKDEQVFNLARSIAEAGPNPLAPIGVVQLGGPSGKKNYQVWEGNRRICAIKLLNDTDLAPAHLRKDFTRLVTDHGYTPIKKINAVVFDDHDDLKFWMGIIHNGAQAGVGLKDWDAQQKARHFGSGRNQVALAVLDAAESMGMITKDEREGKLTTAQRFLNRNVVREALGLDATNREDVTFNRPPDDFKKLLGRFISDLKAGTKVTSRHNRDQIDAYGRGLARNVNVSGDRVQPESLKTVVAASIAARPKRTAKAKKPKKRDRLEFDKDLQRALETISSDKLETLYYSLCSIPLEAHAPLLCIGVWAFVESLTARAGKSGDTDFLAYYSNQKLNELIGNDKKKMAPVRDALTRIQRDGNATKHHETSATFHGRQLANDLATITPLLVKTLENTTPKK
jgi:hypothetical protein